MFVQVPEYKPQAALAFFDKFVNGEEWLAPPLLYPADIDGELAAAAERRKDRAARIAIPTSRGRPGTSLEDALAGHLRRTSASKADDEVKSLPDVKELGSKHYSGFLAVNRLDSSEVSDAIHYWHVEAEDADPDEAPLVVWLTGGPGGSSVGAALTEHGPLILNRTGHNLIPNPYAWSGPANMLFLESPAGVGFSYCAEQLSDPDVICSASDESAAAGNLDALRAFLGRFPQYEGRDFFITGESYAGVYVPTLSAAVYESELVKDGKLNFLGWADGDPCTDDLSQANEYGFSSDFALRRGVIDERLAERLSLCLDGPDSLRCKRAQYQYAVAKGDILLSDDYPMLFDGYNVYVHHHAAHLPSHPLSTEQARDGSSTPGSRAHLPPPSPAVRSRPAHPPDRYGVSDDKVGQPGLIESHAYMNRYVDVRIRASERTVVEIATELSDP